MEKIENYSVTEIVLENIMNGTSPEQIQVDQISLSNYLNYLLGRRDIPLTILAELAGINRATLYKILSGNIKPSRDVVIRLCLELQTSFDEAQKVLKLASCATLSGTRKRDIFIINAFVNRQSIGILDDMLIKNGLESILPR